MARGKDAKIERLGQVYLFRRCSKKELARIASIADEVEMEAGRVLCQEGRFAHECFVIEEGKADVKIGDHVVATLGPGESVGEMGLLDRQPRSATVVARERMVVYVIDGQRFDALLEDVPQVAKGLLQELSSRVRHLDAAYAGESSDAS